MNLINVYSCSTCGQQIVTKNTDDGTTSFYLNCRATPGCPGQMRSHMYKVDQTLEPTFEWYKPKRLPRDWGMRQHVQRGGLMIRPIVKRESAGG